MREKRSSRSFTSCRPSLPLSGKTRNRETETKMMMRHKSQTRPSAHSATRLKRDCDHHRGKVLTHPQSRTECRSQCRVWVIHASRNQEFGFYSGNQYSCGRRHPPVWLRGGWCVLPMPLFAISFSCLEQESNSCFVVSPGSH